MNNPTPPTDDLRARHLSQLKDMLAFSANDFQKPALKWAIAALSALPAGGEPVGEVYALGTGERRVHLDKPYRDLPIGTKLYTTPPPAASPVAMTQASVEGGPVVSLNSPHAPAEAVAWRYRYPGNGWIYSTTRPPNKTGDAEIEALYTAPSPDAAVGAQGEDGLVLAAQKARDLIGMALMTPQGARVTLHLSRAQEVRDSLAAALAAPAAGKGVDDAMRQWAQGLIEQLPGDHDGRNSWMLNHGVGEESDWLRAEHARYTQAWQDWREGYPQPERKPNPFRQAALTRQPVAGDGK